LVTKTIKVALAGAGAFGLKHLDAIQSIDGVEAVSLVGRELDKTKQAAAKYRVGHATSPLRLVRSARAKPRFSAA
jgi:2-hydroxy-4-carboxymuconate semialdehyde hemiacetal dehydrogenase